MGNYFNEKMETMSRDEMLALQSERLVDTVRRVYDHVAPYRAKMDAIGIKPEDIRSVEDLSKLPFTTKQDLRDQLSLWTVRAATCRCGRNTRFQRHYR